MMKEEFENLLGHAVRQKEYDIIEKVYTFHPAISNRTGKEDIVTLYKMGGLRLMKDMLPTAKAIDDLELAIASAGSRIRELQAEKQALSKGE